MNDHSQWVLDIVERSTGVVGEVQRRHSVVNRECVWLTPTTRTGMYLRHAVITGWKDWNTTCGATASFICEELGLEPYPIVDRVRDTIYSMYPDERAAHIAAVLEEKGLLDEPYECDC